MSKKLLIHLVTLSAISIIYFSWNSHDNLNIQNHAEEKTISHDDVSTNEIIAAKKMSEPKKKNNIGEATQVQSKIPYEGNWCFKNIDLTEEDLQFAKQESKDWAEKRGNIFFNKEDFNGDFTEPKNSELLEPYKEMDILQLLELADRDDQLAMIASIQREDVDSSIQNKIAKRLIELGGTSFGLFYLIASEMIDAKSEFERKEEVTASIKQNLINALTYVSYGNSRYDTFALMNFLTIMESDEVYKKALDPTKVLSLSDFEEVRINRNRLAENIDDIRISENLPPISQIDIPKIALREFQENLSIFYLEHGDYLDRLQSIDSDIGASIKRSPCVKRYLDLFGNR